MSSAPVKGIQVVLGQIEARRKGMIVGAQKGLGFALSLILQVSNSRTPFEEGDLTRDGAVVIDLPNLRGAVTYGNDPKVAKYAERQHEDMTLKHDAGKQAKFLETARNESRDKAVAILAAQIKKGMGG